jgi:8-oxo-dGTP pyrophosphatase MutT (NUDIX family)
VNVVVVNDDGAILLIRRTDNDNWSLPGGAIDIGESIADAAVREVREETGIVCEVTGLALHQPTSRDRVHQQRRSPAGVLPRFHRSSGRRTPTPSSESAEVVWVAPDDLNRYPMHASMRQRIEHYLEHRGQPYIG